MLSLSFRSSFEIALLQVGVESLDPVYQVRYALYRRVFVEEKGE